MSGTTCPEALLYLPKLPFANHCINPHAPTFVTYFNKRDFSADAEDSAAGDLGPEGVEFIPAKDSPIRKPLLAVGNEVRGNTTRYKITA